MSTADFEVEGLLEGLSGEPRSSREALLRRLRADGAGIDELRSAIDEDRLPLLPLERMLAGELRHTPEQLAELSGIDLEELERQWRAVGITVAAQGGRVFSDEDLAAARRQRALLDAGLSADQVVELGRVIAVAMSQLAAASRLIVASLFVGAEDTEEDAAVGLAERSAELIPLVAPTMEYAYKLHLREQLRHAAFEAADGAQGTVTTIAFADLVGFTRLGEELPPEELGRVTGRLEELSRDVARGPVRLVKLIGDAAMFASPDTGALLDATNDLIELMEADDELPLIRAGVARGPVLARGGDFYGGPVNLASRITGIARAGSILVAEEVHDEVRDRFRFSKAGIRSLKGLKDSVPLFRCRPLEVRDEDGEEQEEAPAAAEQSNRRRRRHR